MGAASFHSSGLASILAGGRYIIAAQEHFLGDLQDREHIFLAGVDLIEVFQFLQLFPHGFRSFLDDVGVLLLGMERKIRRVKRLRIMHGRTS